MFLPRTFLEFKPECQFARLVAAEQARSEITAPGNPVSLLADELLDSLSPAPLLLTRRLLGSWRGQCHQRPHHR
jgi:hypothetical protein